MFCPQCGQQQASGIVRFCSRCGFPLDGVIQLLGSGGMVPVYREPEEPVPASPRRKGVKQGGMLFLSGAVIVPILGRVCEFFKRRISTDSGGAGGNYLFHRRSAQDALCGAFRRGRSAASHDVWPSADDATAAVCTAASERCVTTTACSFTFLVAPAKHGGACRPAECD